MEISSPRLGPGNCPEFSPEDSQIVFLYNGPTTPGGDSGVYFMQADGSNRRPLGIYGRPKWSPQSQQLLIAGFSRPTIVTIMDIRPEQSEELDVPGHQIFSVPNWVSEGTIVAVIGPAGGPGDTIALVDVTAAARGKVKEVLWKRTTEADVLPYGPIYSPVSRRCVFIGKTPGKGRALYTFEPGKPAALRRLESGGSFDNLIQDPIFSPDGRFVVFSTDRKPPLGPGDDVPSSRPDAGTDPTLWSRRVGSSAKSPDTSAPPRDRPRLP
jgi:Tol biopolymer transport system component